MIKKYAIYIIVKWKVEIAMPEKQYDTYEEAEIFLEKLVSSNDYQGYTILPYYTKK